MGTADNILLFQTLSNKEFLISEIGGLIVSH